MTSVKEILQSVLGLKLEFLGDSPVKHNSCISQFSKEDESAINLDVQKLSAKGQPVSVPYPGEHCLTHQGKRQIFKKCSRVRPKSKFSTGEIRKSTSETMKPTGDDMKIQRGELTNILR